MEYAITDIETTGGHASGNGITEICIYIHDGKKVKKKFRSLVRPPVPIPAYISGLTGITGDMVKRAPDFSKIAKRVHTLLSGRVFTAHNVNFDYSFLKKHLAECGYEWQSKKLCTMRLSRRLFPGLPSYSLANICGYHDITIPNRHRAEGDASATVLLFEKMLAADTAGVIESFLKRHSGETQLPPNLPGEEFAALPRQPGVYYFIGRSGKPVYVGKAKDLKKRVSSHFTGNSAAPQRQHFMREIYHLRFTVCKSEEEAIALETAEIKKLWPRYNRAQKRYDPLYGIVSYYDQTGFLRLGLKKLQSKRETPLQVKSVLEGHETLRQIVAGYDLCLRLSGIPKSKEHCIRENCVCTKTGKRQMANYNKKVKQALIEVIAED